MTDCVNMETKTCFFGYGGVHVSVVCQSLRLYGIKPPVGAGTHIYDENGNKIGDWEHTVNNLYVLFNTMNEVNHVCDLLKAIEDSQGGSFTFKGVTFDFVKYEQASMEVVKSAMEMVRRNMVFLMAC
jgi:hypothetical protein